MYPVTDNSNASFKQKNFNEIRVEFLKYFVEYLQIASDAEAVLICISRELPNLLVKSYLSKYNHQYSTNGLHNFGKLQHQWMLNSENIIFIALLFYYYVSF